MNTGIKIALTLGSVVGAYWIGVKVGKVIEREDSNKTLEIYKKNNEILNRECINLLSRNNQLKKFYNVVECIKMEEA